MYHIPIKQQLAQISRADQGRPRKKVLILGAGMAGLAAGYELAQRGHEVEIFEGSKRLGGRVFTHRFKNQQHAEFGAMRIPKSHDYTRHYVEQFQLPLRPFINSSPATYRDFEGTICRAKESAQKIGDRFDLSRPDREAILNSQDHDEIYVRLMQKVLAYLSEEDKVLLFSGGPLSAKLSHLDKSLLQTFHHYAETHDAIRFMGKITILDDYWDRSTLMFVREEIEESFSGLEAIVGGMDCLPQALADAQLPDQGRLCDRLTYSREISAIAVENEGVTISFLENGRQETSTFPYVLCTIPFSVLRRMDIKGLPTTHQDAIQGLGYHSSSKVLVNCTERFWELQDGIYGGASLSDSIARMTFYPSDNAERQQEISQGPGVLLGSYTWGTTARRLGLLSPSERGELVVNKIERFHPKIKKYLDASEPYASISWDQYRFAAGAFSSPNPQQIQMFFPAVSQPAGRLFFAGEHLSPCPTWIQGGLWSAMQAVMQIVVA